MATSQKVTDQFLTCAVCMDVFKDPCTLKCQHTFCKRCLVSFTKTQPDAISTKSLPCATCRSLTKVSDPDRPVEEWVDQMKPSFLIQKLMDSFGPGTKDTTLCRCCKDRGEITLATSWCSVCDDAFCAGCENTHSHAVTQSLIEESLPTSRHVAADRNMCREHPTEPIAYICHDCSKSICHKCCIRDHRRCNSVVEVDSNDLSDLKLILMKKKYELLKKSKLVADTINKENSKLQEMTEYYFMSESEIKSECEKARDMITAKESVLLVDLKKKVEQQTIPLQGRIQKRKLAVDMYQEQSSSIDQAVKSQSDKAIQTIHQLSESWLKSMDIDVGEGEIAKIVFEKDTESFESLKELQLGVIEVVYDGGLNLMTRPVLQDNIDVMVKGDTRDAWSTDVTVLTVKSIETIVVVDRNNTCVKSFYTRNGLPCQSKLSLNSEPWSLTQMKHNQVAVTVPGTRQLITVEVNPDLKLLSSITTGKGYRGIVTMADSSFAVSFRSGSYRCVDIVNTSGTVIRSISHDAYMRYPDFLSRTRKGNILVSDSGTKAVLCLTPEGNVVFNYNPMGNQALQFPLGITCTSTGDILIADSPTHTVVHLSESGEFVKYLLTSRDGLMSPRGLCVDRCGRLYVCHDGDVAIFKDKS